MNIFPIEEKDEYDREFLMLFLEIDKMSTNLNKHNKLKVVEWSKKLSQVTQNKEWKKNRNLYTILLLDNLINNKLDEPFNKFPPEGSLPLLNKTIIKSTLSTKFYTLNENDLNLNYEKSKVINIRKLSPVNYNTNSLSRSDFFQSKPLSLSCSVNKKRNVRNYIEEFEIIKLKKELNELITINNKLNQELRKKEESIIGKERDNKLLTEKIRNLESMSHQLISNPRDKNTTKYISKLLNKNI